MRSIRTIALISFAALFAAPWADAQEAKDQDRKSRIQMHEQMARQHQKAAKCLKAGRTVEECNQEAMKGCPMMKSGKCPFMDGMGMSHDDHGGMMHGDGMMDSGDEKKTSKDEKK